MGAHRAATCGGMWGAVAIAVLILAGACTDERAESAAPANGSQAWSEIAPRRPKLGGMLFEKSRGAPSLYRKFPKSGEVVILGSGIRRHLGFAYDVKPRDIVFEKDLAVGVLFDAAMRPADYELETSRRVLRAYLENRFDIEVEDREEMRPVFVLSPTRSAMPLRPSPHGPASLKVSRGEIRVVHKPLSVLVAAIERGVKRPVVDESGLDGVYDYVVQWDASSGGYAIIHALGDLGLKIDAGQRLVHRLVVKSRTNDEVTGG